MFRNLFLSKLSAFKSNNSVLPHGINCNLLLVVEKDVYDDFSSIANHSSRIWWPAFWLEMLSPFQFFEKSGHYYHRKKLHFEYMEVSYLTC